MNLLTTYSNKGSFPNGSPKNKSPNPQSQDMVRQGGVSLERLARLLGGVRLRRALGSECGGAQRRCCNPPSPPAHAAQVAGGSEMKLEEKIPIRPPRKPPSCDEEEYEQDEDKSLDHERRFVVIVGVRPLQFPRGLDPVNASSAFVSSLECFGARGVEFARVPPSLLPRHGSTRGCQS